MTDMLSRFCSVLPIRRSLSVAMESMALFSAAVEGLLVLDAELV